MTTQSATLYNKNNRTTQTRATSSYLNRPLRELSVITALNAEQRSISRRVSQWRNWRPRP